MLSGNPIVRTQRRELLFALRVLSSLSLQDSFQSRKASLPRGAARKYSYRLTFKNVVLEVLTAVDVKSSVFWDIPPCGPLKVNRCFGGSFFDPEDGGDMFLRKVG
jgi:hypothetical protein